MPKWTSFPPDPLKYNPYQDAFWNARRSRICPTCHTASGDPLKFDISVNLTCPTCSTVGKREFHRLLLLAGRRGGKTKAASIAAVEEAMVPGTIGWCCAPSNPKLHRYVIPAIQQLIPPDWVASWSSEFGDLRLKNGSLIHFQTLEDPDQGRGQGLHWVWIDEICELTEQHWLVLRPSLTEHRGVAFFSSSPRSFDWVYETFYQQAEKGTPGYWACRYKTSDNPMITEEEVADARATMPDAMFKQEYEADFVNFEGAVYGDLIDPQILRTPEHVKTLIPEWPDIADWRIRLVGIDTGANHPFGAVKLVSSDHGLIVVGEYLERYRTFVEHANSIKQLAAHPKTRYAINKNELQPAIELSQHNIHCQKAENDQVAGVERVKTWLHMKQLWFVEFQCPMTIQQMKTLRWDRSEDTLGRALKEKVYKKKDELPDCIRYALMSWPTLPKAPAPEEYKRDLSQMPDDMRRAIERNRRIDNPPVETTETTKDFWL